MFCRFDVVCHAYRKERSCEDLNSSSDDDCPLTQISNTQIVAAEGDLDIGTTDEASIVAAQNDVPSNDDASLVAMQNAGSSADDAGLIAMANDVFSLDRPSVAATAPSTMQVFR